MALLASYYVHHPMSISHLCLTGEYLLASTASGTVNVLNLHCRHTERSSSCKHRTTIEVGEMWDFDCYQNMLVTANNDHLLRVWDVSAGTLQRTLVGHSGALTKVLIADPTIVISSSRDSTVIVWDLQTGVPRWTLAGHGAMVECLMIHGNLLFTGARDGTVAAWDLENGQCVRVLQGHTTPVWKMTMHQDGSLLATGASGGSMRIWDTTSNNCIAQCEGHSKIITQFANLSENQLMTSAAEGTIQTWDWTTGRHISTLAAHENAVRGFFLTDQRMVSGGMDGCVHIWNRMDGTISHEMRAKVRAVWHLVSNPNIIALALLVEGGKHLIEIWDASVL